MEKFKVAYLAWLGANYGSTLQSYALYRSIINLGYACQVIDYDHFIKNDCPPVSLKESDPKNYDGSLMRYNFDLFAEKHFVFNKILHNIDNDLVLSSSQSKEIGTIDAFVCGSDQIWKPGGFWFKSKQYLQFSPPLKRIGYAPSVGWKTIPLLYKKNIPKWKSWLSSVAYLSTRESSGSTLVEDVTGRPVSTVVDPTLLLTPEEWLSFMKEPKYSPQIETVLRSGDRFMLAYFLDHRPMFEKKVLALAKRLKLKVVWLSGRGNVGPIQENCADTDPAGFVNLINMASFVCADGFHGACFALNFSKPVAFFSPLKEPGKSNDSRVLDLCKRFGIDPIKRTVTPWVSIRNISAKLNYDEIQKKIALEREASLTYLKNALMGATQSKGPLFQELKECGAFFEYFPEEHYSGRSIINISSLKFSTHHHSSVELHTIRNHTVIIPSSANTSLEACAGKYVYASLGVCLLKGQSYEFHVRVMLLTSSPAVDISLFNSRSLKFQSVLTIKKAMMGSERWLDLFARFTTDDDCYDSLMVDASQLTGRGAYISFSSVDIIGRDK